MLASASSRRWCSTSAAIVATRSSTSTTTEHRIAAAALARIAPETAARPQISVQVESDAPRYGGHPLLQASPVPGPGELPLGEPMADIDPSQPSKPIARDQARTRRGLVVTCRTTSIRGRTGGAAFCCELCAHRVHSTVVSIVQDCLIEKGWRSSR